MFVIDTQGVKDHNFCQNHFEANDIEYFRSMFDAVEVFKKYCDEYKNKKGRWEIYLTYAIRTFTFNSKTNIGLVEHFPHDIHTDMTYYLLIDSDDNIKPFGKNSYNEMVEEFHRLVNEFSVDPEDHEDDYIYIYIGGIDAFEMFENL